MAKSTTPSETTATPAVATPTVEATVVVANAPAVVATEDISSEQVQESAEAQVATKDKFRKVSVQEDHTCSIGDQSVFLERGKDVTLREDIALQLNARRIVLLK